LKIFLDKDVHTMALERIRWVFANFPNVRVSFSGGKDSCLQLN